jgi:hypothetical protein
MAAPWKNTLFPDFTILTASSAVVIFTFDDF